MSKVIYVAGDWEERAAAREYMSRLERAGFENAIDWTDSAVFSAARDDVLVEGAQAKVLALQRSQVFWLITPAPPRFRLGSHADMWWELGYCTALFGGDAAYPILISGNLEHPISYTNLPGLLRFPTDEEAFEALCDYMKLGKAIRVKP